MSKNNNRRSQRRDDPGAIDGRAAVQDYGNLKGRELGAARAARREMLLGMQYRATPAKAMPKVRKSWAQRMTERVQAKRLRLAPEFREAIKAFVPGFYRTEQGELAVRA